MSAPCVSPEAEERGPVRQDPVARARGNLAEGIERAHPPARSAGRRARESGGRPPPELRRCARGGSSTVSVSCATRSWSEQDARPARPERRLRLRDRAEDAVDPVEHGAGGSRASRLGAGRLPRGAEGGELGEVALCLGRVTAEGGRPAGEERARGEQWAHVVVEHGRRGRVREGLEGGRDAAQHVLRDGGQALLDVLELRPGRRAFFHGAQARCHLLGPPDDLGHGNGLRRGAGGAGAGAAGAAVVGVGGEGTELSEGRPRHEEDAEHEGKREADARDHGRSTSGHGGRG